MSKKIIDPDLKFTINLVLGDWSNDGHGWTETVVICSNLDTKSLEKAYKAGAKKAGVDWKNCVAKDYKDNSITIENVDKLAVHGFKIEDVSEDDEPEDSKYSLYTNGYTLGWLFVAKLGNPDFRYEIVENSCHNINIGGYGLFCD